MLPNCTLSTAKHCYQHPKRKLQHGAAVVSISPFQVTSSPKSRYYIEIQQKNSCASKYTFLPVWIYSFGVLLVVSGVLAYDHAELHARMKHVGHAVSCTAYDYVQLAIHTSLMYYKIIVLHVLITVDEIHVALHVGWLIYVHASLRVMETFQIGNYFICLNSTFLLFANYLTAKISRPIRYVFLCISRCIHMRQTERRI